MTQAGDGHQEKVSKAHLSLRQGADSQGGGPGKKSALPDEDQDCRAS